MFNYDRNIVAIAYKFQNRRAGKVSEQALLDFDAGLHARFHTEIVRQATAAEIPLDGFSLSILMLFANLSSVSRSVRARVENACEYYESVRPQPPLNLNWIAQPGVTVDIDGEDAHGEEDNGEPA